MIDRLFTSTLAFAILAGATLAIGGEYFSTQGGERAPMVAELPRVVVTGEVRPAQTEIASIEATENSSRATDRVQ